ncbi:MAG TPA: porin [Polyangia bacterium]|nr:porin [Polyangia bacterium]
MSPSLRFKLAVVSVSVALTSIAAPARLLAQDAPAEKAVPSEPAVAVPPAGSPAPAVPSGGPQDRGSAAPPQPPPPVAPTAVPAVAPWQGRYDEIEQRTRALERNALGPIFQTDENGFAIISREGLYQIRWKGLLQVDGRAFLNDGALASADTFVARKIRPILAGTVLGLTDFYFAPDFGNNTQIVADAFLDTHPRPWLRLRVGKFKQPYGLERLQADQDLVFIERGLDQNLTPQREVGVQLWGDVAGGIVRYEAGIFNGNPDYGLNDVDDNKYKTFGGRIFVQPFNTPGLRALGRLGVGIAGSTGVENGSPALTNGAASNTWLPAFKSAGQQTIFSYLSSTTDPTLTIVASGRHSRVNPQLYYYKGPFGLLAEWVREHQNIARGGASGALNNSSGHVTASVAIGGEVTYEGVKPRRALDLARGGYGALEIGFRYNWLRLDQAAFPTAADPNKSVAKADGYGVALNWQLSRNLKASANFEQTWFSGGAKNGNRKTEDLLVGRFQIAF